MRRERIPELDGWRVLLIFVVSWYHIWQQSWLTPYIGTYSLDFLVRAGYMLVDGTILLSGFLLFLPYASAMREGGQTPPARDFYLRRVARIVPSYVVFTLIMLFAVALPQGLYRSGAAMAKDLLMHFTFTFTFDLATYVGTPLGAASWTLCVEMQFYLLFPLLARLVMRRPAATLLGMAAVSAYFRLWAVWHFTAYDLVVNQLVSFLDVYALGMALAMLYVALKEAWPRLRRPGWGTAMATAIFFLCLITTLALLRRQAAESGGVPAIQAGQMARRLPLCLLLGGCMLSLPFAARPIRLLFGNRVTRFLSAISMNFYLLHQPLAVQLKRLRIPPSQSPTPNQAGETAWQYPYTFLCFLLSLLSAALLTYLIERPCARAILKKKR